MIASARRHRARFTAVLTLLVMLSACSVLQTPEAARQWLLEVDLKPAKRLTPAAATPQSAISVQWPTLSSPYNQDRVWIAQEGELLALKGVRWRADVPVLLQDTLQQMLRASGRFSSVNAAPTSSAWHLALTAPDFRAIRTANGYRVDLQLEWRLQCQFDVRQNQSGQAFGQAETTAASALQGTFQRALNAAQQTLSSQLEPIEFSACQQPSP